MSFFKQALFVCILNAIGVESFSAEGDMIPAENQKNINNVCLYKINGNNDIFKNKNIQKIIHNIEEERPLFLFDFDENLINRAGVDCRARGRMLELLKELTQKNIPWFVLTARGPHADKGGIYRGLSKECFNDFVQKNSGTAVGPWVENILLFYAEFYDLEENIMFQRRPWIKDLFVQWMYGVYDVPGQKPIKALITKREGIQFQDFEELFHLFYRDIFVGKNHPFLDAQHHKEGFEFLPMEELFKKILAKPEGDLLEQKLPHNFQIQEHCDAYCIKGRFIATNYNQKYLNKFNVMNHIFQKQLNENKIKNIVFSDDGVANIHAMKEGGLAYLPNAICHLFWHKWNQNEEYQYDAIFKEIPFEGEEGKKVQEQFKKEQESLKKRFEKIEINLPYPSIEPEGVMWKEKEGEDKHYEDLAKNK